MVSISVRHIEKADYQAVASIYTTEAVIRQTTQVPHRTAEFWENFYSQVSPSKVELVGLCDQHIAGHLGLLLNTNPRRKHSASFGIAVHPDYQGLGVGKALMDEMINLCDNWLNIIRLELKVNIDNAIAIKLYKKCGFEEEGVSQFDCFRQGSYGSSLNMARFHPSHKTSTDHS